MAKHFLPCTLNSLTFTAVFDSRSMRLNTHFSQYLETLVAASKKQRFNNKFARALPFLYISLPSLHHYQDYKEIQRKSA